MEYIHRSFTANSAAVSSNVISDLHFGGGIPVLILLRIPVPIVSGPEVRPPAPGAR